MRRVLRAKVAEVAAGAGVLVAVEAGAVTVAAVVGVAVEGLAVVVAEADINGFRSHPFCPCDGERVRPLLALVLV
jgi:hypothetical protein